MSDAKILIVEDEGIEALDIQHRLISLGYTNPEIVFSGEEAIKKTEEMQPDLVLMDIMLHGGIDGITTAKQINDRFDIPIVYLTAYADEETLQRAKTTAPYGYIIKPFKERELHITIDVALYKHKMEKRLKESEKWLATTLRSIGDAVITTNKEGLVTFMNPIAEGLTGRKLEEASCRSLTEVFRIVNRDTGRVVENPVMKVLSEGVTEGLANHTVLIARNGTRVPIDDSAAPIKDDRGNMMGAILVFRDITEREKAERSLQKAHDELEQRVKERTSELREANAVLEAEILNRKKAEEALQRAHDELEQRVKERTSELEEANKELEGFAYSVSHDLRAPLRAIDGFSDMILKDSSDSFDEETRRRFDVIQANARKMGRLIDDLLAFSRAGRAAINFVNIDMKGLVQEVLKEEETANREHGFHVQLDELPPACGDRSLLRQVVANLIENAIKFTRGKPDPHIKVGSYKTDDGECVYYVKDNGVGFDMKYYDKLFGVFQRLVTDRQFEGTGVGLALVHRLVSRHGGRVWAEGKPREGATFYFTLGKTVK